MAIGKGARNLCGVSGRADRLFISAGIDATDIEIDWLVYRLTDDEIAIVEDAIVATAQPSEENGRHQGWHAAQRVTDPGL